LLIDQLLFAKAQGSSKRLSKKKKDKLSAGLVQALGLLLLRLKKEIAVIKQSSYCSLHPCINSNISCHASK